MQVSVVIVSYNVLELLTKCVDTLFKFTRGVEWELIVVDNNSTDGSIDYLKKLEKEKGVKIILSKENLGFSKGNNLGIKQAKGEYVFLLNPDTELVENSIPVMKKWMDEHAGYAVMSCQMLDFEQKVSPTGGYSPNLFRMAMWSLFLDDLPLISKIVKSYHPHVTNVPWSEFFVDLPFVRFFMKPSGVRHEISRCMHMIVSLTLTG